MKNIFILLSCIVLFSCGQTNKDSQEKLNNQVAEPKPEEKVVEDSTLIKLNTKIRADINNPDLYVQRSKIYDSIGDTKAAIEDLDRAFKLDSNRLPTLLAQAEFLSQKGKIALSLNILERAKTLYPESSEIYTSLSEIFLYAKNNKRSLKNADLAIKYDLYNAKAYYLKGYNFLEMGDTLNAISSYRTAIEQDPDYFAAYVELGLIFSEKDDPIALQYYENALEIKPFDKKVLYAKGMYEQEHELYNEALATYNTAVKAHPDFKEAHYNIGYVHMYYLRLYRKATQYFTDAIEADPTYYQAYYNRGYSFEMMGDVRNAAKDYRKSLSIQPDYDLAAKGLSRVTEGI